MLSPCHPAEFVAPAASWKVWQLERVVNSGTARPARSIQTVQRITFEDLAIAHKAELELQEVVEFLTSPRTRRASPLNGVIPKRCVARGSRCGASILSY
jgi:hypothetical protein